MPTLGSDELWNEGEEKQRSLGIQYLCDRALRECIAERSNRTLHIRLRIAAMNHAYSEIHQVGRPSVLHNRKRHGRCRQHCGNAERGAKHMH